MGLKHRQGQKPLLWSHNTIGAGVHICTVNSCAATRRAAVNRAPRTAICVHSGKLGLRAVAADFRNEMDYAVFLPNPLFLPVRI